MTTTQQISINGENYPLKSPEILLTVITRTDFCADKIAIAVNGCFIPQGQYQTLVINPGDCIDIVKPIGGG